MVTENFELIGLREFTELRPRKPEVFNPQKRRIEITRIDFVYRNCRKTNRTDNEVNFSKTQGLKKRPVELMRKEVNGKFSEQKSCTWQLCCDSQRCKSKWMRRRVIPSTKSRKSTSTTTTTTTTSTNYFSVLDKKNGNVKAHIVLSSTID